MKFTKILSLILCVVLCFGMVSALTACGGDKNYAENNTKIKIGLSGPLTGGASSYGIAVKNSAQLAVDEINANGGLDGIMFELVMTDDKHDPTLVSANYASLYEGGMQISLGTVTTAPGLEYKELSKDNNVFVLTPSASGDDIPEYDNAFQMCFADSNQGAVSAKVFNETYAGKKIGIFYKSDDEYSTGIRAKFVENLSADLKANLAEASFKGEESDFATQVSLLKDCDVIFMPIYVTPASQFMTASKSVAGFKASVFYGCDGLDGIDGAIENFDITSINAKVSYLTHFTTGAAEGTAAADFVAKYNAKYDEAKEPVNQFGASAYDCVYAIYDALCVAKENGEEFSVTTSPAKFCEILTKVFTSDDFVFHGITGAPEASREDGKSNITWDDNGFVSKEPLEYIAHDPAN